MADDAIDFGSLNGAVILYGKPCILYHSTIIAASLTVHLICFIFCRSLCSVFAEWLEQYVMHPSGKWLQKIAFPDESLSVTISFITNFSSFTFSSSSLNMLPSAAFDVPSQLCPCPLLVR